MTDQIVEKLSKKWNAIAADVELSMHPSDDELTEDDTFCIAIDRGFDDLSVEEQNFYLQNRKEVKIEFLHRMFGVKTRRR